MKFLSMVFGGLEKKDLWTPERRFENSSKAGTVGDKKMGKFSKPYVACAKCATSLNLM